MEASDGSIWVGTWNGVSRFRKPGIILVTTRMLRPPPAILGESRVSVEAQGVEVGTDKLPPLSMALVQDGREPEERDWSPFGLTQWITTGSVAIVKIADSGFELSGMHNGTWTLHVRSRDRYGGMNVVSRVFRVDTTAPTVVISRPRLDDTISGVVPVMGSAFDESDMPDLEQYILEYGRGRGEKQVDQWLRDDRILDLASEPKGDEFLDEFERKGPRGWCRLTTGSSGCKSGCRRRAGAGGLWPGADASRSGRVVPGGCCWRRRCR